MPRRNGSFFGITVAPTPSVASGIWRVSEAEEYLRVNKWPATPGVPGSPSGAPGNGQVALTWSAPTLGSPPTAYLIQYSDDSGSTWTTFDPGSNALSATVTGLTNGTGYIFRVVAINALGQGPYGSASGTITPAALPVALLCHFDGSNASTTFTDSSPNALTVTPYGGAQLNTAAYKFGTASLLLDNGTDFNGGSYIVAEGVPDGLGSGDFTIEMWLNASANAAPYTAPYLLDLRPTSTLALYFTEGAFNYYNGGNYSFAWTPTVGEWYHLAIVRQTGNVSIYVNGSLLGDPISDSNDYTVSGSNIKFFARYSDSGFQYFSGRADELRVVVGTAVYTNAFTPPTGPF